MSCILSSGLCCNYFKLDEPSWCWIIPQLFSYEPLQWIKSIHLVMVILQKLDTYYNYYIINYNIWAIGKTPNTKCDLGFEVIVFGNALYRFTVFAASTKNIIFQNACGKPFQSSNSGSAKSQIFTATSSPSWAHLPLHGHIYPFMATSSPSWAHLPLHGFIYLFMATSSPSWAHLPLRGHIHHGKAFCAEMVIVRLSFWLSFKTGNISGKINFMTSPPARRVPHN